MKKDLIRKKIAEAESQLDRIWETAKKIGLSRDEKLMVMVNSLRLAASNIKLIEALDNKSYGLVEALEGSLRYAKADIVLDDLYEKVAKRFIGDEHEEEETNKTVNGIEQK